MNLRNKRGIGLTALILIIVAILIIGGVATFVIVKTVIKSKIKEPITYKGFISIMEDKDFIIHDVKNQFAQYDYIEHAYVAMSEDSEYQIEFYEIADEENSIYMFNYNKTRFELTKSSMSTETNVSIGNNDKYTLTTGDKYKVVSRIGNTLIYIDADKEYKEDIKEILKELGY